jgi:hypothetical protein
MPIAPAQWLIQLISLLPVALRPGVFLAVVVSLAWFVFVRRGLPSLWRLSCRGVAITVDLAVGLALFPEYLLTTSRRSRGGQPGSMALTVAPVAEHVLHAAAALYERSLPKETSKEASKEISEPASKKTPKRRFPWIWCALVIAACAGAWIAMDQMAPGEEAKRTLAEAFEHWRDVEAWADVSPSRRAAPGDPIAPAVVSVSYHRWEVRMALHCPDSNPCKGTVNVRTQSGATLSSKPVELQSEGRRVITVALPHRPANALQHLRVEVDPP